MRGERTIQFRVGGEEKLSAADNRIAGLKVSHCSAFSLHLRRQQRELEFLLEHECSFHPEP